MSGREDPTVALNSESYFYMYVEFQSHNIKQINIHVQNGIRNRNLSVPSGPVVRFLNRAASLICFKRIQT